MKEQALVAAVVVAVMVQPVVLASVVQPIVLASVLADLHKAMALSVNIPERTPELDGASGARTSYRQRACLHVCVSVS